MYERIVSDPDICGGKPTVRGTRITVETVLAHLSAGDTQDDIIAAYPELRDEDVRACLKYARSVISREVWTQ